MVVRGAVLDANVLIPAPLRDILLRSAEAGLFRPYWSEQILSEMRRNLIQRGMTDEARAKRLVEVMQHVFPEAMIRGYDPLIPRMTNDPKDRHVLAVAVFAKAEIIVTNNLRDFPSAALAPWNVEAQHPDRFLSDLFDAAPAVFVQIVREQAADLARPPVSAEGLLTILAAHVSRFSQKVRDRLTTA